MPQDELMTFIDKSLERDLADLNLEAQLRRLAAPNPEDEPDPAVVRIISKTLLAVGPQLFRSGYLAGAKTGMEVARAIHKQSGHELWASRSEHRKED